MFYQSTLTISVIICLVVLILHVLVFEAVIVLNLERDYKLMRMLFCFGVPEYILTNEKVIKHRLFKAGILCSA